MCDNAMYRKFGQGTTNREWITLGDWLGLDVRQLPRISAWNAICAAVGLPRRELGDTITADEWNYAVESAIARHA